MHGAVSASVPPPGYTPPPGAGTPSSASTPDPAPAPITRRSRPRVPRRLIAGGLGLLVAVAAVFVLLALTSNKAVDPIAEAASASTKQLGFRMNMRFAISSPSLGAPIAASGTAAVDPRDRTASMSLAIDYSHLPAATQALGGGTLQMAVIVLGRRAYVKLPQGVVNKVPRLGGKPWVEVNVTKATGVPGFSSLGGAPTTTDPAAMLHELLAGADSVSNEGQQFVDGVQTTHYRAQFSLERVFAKVPASERALMQKLLGGAAVPLDVWIDAHHLVRRVTMSLALGSPSGPALQATFAADISDYGPQPRPTPPPADQVTDASSIASGLLG
jgi:hypothetical protein